MATLNPPDSGDSPAMAAAAMPDMALEIAGASGSEKEADLHDSSALSQGSLDKKRQRTQDESPGDGCKRCSCKKSRCLKLYCVCFASGAYCSDKCQCRQCVNKSAYGDVVQNTRRDLLLRNQRHLFSRAARNSDTNQLTKEDTSNSPVSVQQKKRGCTCKKSGCLKKYCDCYQSGIGCFMNCRCDDCKNPYGKKERQRNLLPFVSQNIIDFGGQSEETEDEDEDEEEKEFESPHHHCSPISRESSFQQETSDDLRAPHVIDRHHHLFPQPISQRQPVPWIFLKRNNEDYKNTRDNYLEYNKPLSENTGGNNNDNNNSNNNIENNNNGTSSNNGSHGDRYTIARCIEVLNGMAELSSLEKAVAPDVFLDPSNREIFLSLNSDVRIMWLRRKMKHLS